MDWKDWKGKKIFVKLKSGSVYSGIVENVDDVFIYLLDKYNIPVTFAILDIIKITEDKK